MTQPLSLVNVTVSVQGRDLVRAVSMSAGGMTGLIGPNGAGKSTLLRAVVGLMPLAAGAIRFDGVDLATSTRRDRAKIVAFVEQSATTEERLTATDVVALGRIPFQSLWQGGLSGTDRHIVSAALDEVGLSGLGNRQFTTLSGGEQQRVLLARALAQEPRLLILDEPTNHLDVHAQMTVLELLRRRSRAGLTVLLALHDLNLAGAYCDHIAALHRAQLVAQGTPDDVLTPALLRDIYDVEVVALKHPGSGRPVIVYEPRNSN